MPEYLATVRAPDGRRVTENVVADSAVEAVQILNERGYGEVQLHNDDVMALYTHQRARTRNLSPREYVQIRNHPTSLGQFWVIMIQGFRRAWFSLVLVLMALAYLRSSGQPWGFFDWLCVYVLALPILLASASVLIGRTKSARYRQMMTALYSGQWEEALCIADRVVIKNQPHEISLRKAQALAGMDRLDEGLALFERFGDGKTIPLWLYHSSLAQIYEFASRRDDAIRQLEQAVALAPDNSTMLLNLARMIIWHRHDPRRASELLSRARSLPMSDMTMPFADYIEGIIVLEEGRPRDALPLLETAYKAFHARRHMTLGFLPLEQAMLGLALCHAALGNSDQAIRLYGKVRPRMVALRSDNIDRCDRTIGLPPEGQMVV